MDWTEFERELQKLAAKIIEKPDVIIGIVRGGLIPARMLAKYFHVAEMYALTVKKDGGNRAVMTNIDEDLAGKSVLIVEDMLESGMSLMAARDYVESLRAEVKTAALYIQPESKVVPDYYLDTKDQVPLFPWD